MKRCIAIYGASGFGREVMPLALDQHGGPDVTAVFVDDGLADGGKVLSFEDFLKRPEPVKEFVIAIANSAVREKLADRCLSAGLASIDVRAANVVTLDDVAMGMGSILGPFALVTSTVTIGRFFHGNYHSYVAHDCVIGDFVTFGPGAKCNGNVHIGDHAYIGSGAVLKQGTPDRPRLIGRGAIIGMGAVVTKDVAPGETVVGNPARPLRRG